MPTHSLHTRASRLAALTASILLGARAIAGAQTTTVTLSMPGTQLTDSVTVQGGASANINFGALDSVATSVGATADTTRRALLKFDTQSTIPAGANIQSATLTMTIKSGGTDATRTVGAYPVTAAFVQNEATWNIRKIGYAWTKAGGDLGALATQHAVSNTAGSKVSFDVRALVQAAVGSASGSRYTRIALADLGAAGAASYREYYGMKAVTASMRPVLTVTYGTPPPPVLVGATLRVLQYNTHHGGYGTDGVYSIARIVSWVVKSNADVVSMNEIEINDGWSQGLDQTVLYQQALQNATHVTWYKAYQNRYGSTSGNGQLILSKYPFIATAGTLLSGGRSALDTTIDVNGRTVNFTSVHLDNVSQTNRLTEISELLPWDATFAENRIIAGDLNARPGTQEIVNMQNGGYVDQWSAAVAAGVSIGDGITHGTHRIDYIFLSKNAANLHVTSMQAYKTADANGVMPSDHQPVLAVFEVK